MFNHYCKPPFILMNRNISIIQLFLEHSRGWVRQLGWGPITYKRGSLSDRGGNVFQPGCNSHTCGEIEFRFLPNQPKSDCIDQSPVDFGSPFPFSFHYW